jgi:hypothetical protein
MEQHGKPMQTFSRDQRITVDMLDGLPAPVQRYLIFSGVVGKPWIENAHVSQTGKFRSGADKPWLPITAEQVFTTNPAGFIWNAQIRLAGLPPVTVRDGYEAGSGSQVGKLAGSGPAFASRGEQLDQGALMRYLAEMIWFPCAFLGPNITWEAIDAESAQVMLVDRGKQVSATMTFDDVGRPINFHGMRFRGTIDVSSLDPWSVPITRWEARAGLNLPIHGLMIWNLADGDLPYYDWAVTKVDYNLPV